MTHPRIDPTCRAAQEDDRHTCTRRDGRPVRDGEPCFAETSRQVREAGRVPIVDADDRADAYDAVVQAWEDRQ